MEILIITIAIFALIYFIYGFILLGRTMWGGYEEENMKNTISKYIEKYKKLGWRSTVIVNGRTTRFAGWTFDEAKEKMDNFLSKQGVI